MPSRRGIGERYRSKSRRPARWLSRVAAILVGPTLLLTAWASCAIALTNTSRPSITGTETLGQTLTGHPGQWDKTVDSSSEWFRCPTQDANASDWQEHCTRVDFIPGENDTSTYKLTSADLGYRLRLHVPYRESPAPTQGAITIQAAHPTRCSVPVHRMKALPPAATRLNLSGCSLQGTPATLPAPC